MQGPASDDGGSVHASHYSDTANLLELSHTLDALSAQFKRCSLDAVKLELARMAAQHAKEMEDLEDRMEGEKRELSRQRDECRQYWYHNKELNEHQYRSLVHRAEHYALTAPARGMWSVWRKSPELLRRAQATPMYGMMLKRTCLQAWRQWAQRARQSGLVERYINRSSGRAALREVFSAWRHVAMKEGWARRDGVFRQQVQTDVEHIINDKDAEIAGLHQRLGDMERRLEAETRHRGALEERLKIAFMRGVCALNLEAMNVMKGEEGLAMSDATPSSGDQATVSPATITATPIQPPSEDFTALHYDPAALTLTTLPQGPYIAEVPPPQPAPKQPTVTPMTRSSPNVICATAPLASSARMSTSASGSISVRPSTGGNGGGSAARVPPTRHSTVVRTNPPHAQRMPMPGTVISRANTSGLSAVLTVKEVQPSKRGHGGQ